MGGKSYFCDYCQCYMKNDINVRRTHNEGLQHKIIKTSVMRKYEDPPKLYEEEIKKQRCFRYFKGYCKYDLYCQFSHFSEHQLKQLHQIVKILHTKSESSLSNKLNFSTKLTGSLKLPYQNKITKRNLKLSPSKLPPSLRPLNLKRLIKVEDSKWGC